MPAQPLSAEVDLPAGLRRRLVELFPDAEVAEVSRMGAGRAAGYSTPLRIRLLRSGGPLQVVFRTANANRYGHDRRADRAAAMLLGFDTFHSIPGHVSALDVGALGPRGALISLEGAGEFYLLTTYAEGDLYADDLRRIASRGATDHLDLRRCDALASWLAELHAAAPAAPSSYRRATRDLLGGGEGIFGVVDGYPDDTPGAASARLFRLERRCLEWRWKLRNRSERLRRIHGDFHPFNVVLQGERVVTLDASRGCVGDPADDVTAMAVNYLFFAVDRPGAWSGLRPLYHRFLEGYLGATADRELLSVAPPYLAWRTLVVCSPDFYPSLSARGRGRLLAHAERALERGRLDPEDADQVFR